MYTGIERRPGTQAHHVMRVREVIEGSAEARSDVFPSPVTSHASPTRGGELVQWV